jgi:ArsR family transcriptional regulator
MTEKDVSRIDPARIGEMLKSLSNPTRLSILVGLYGNECNVSKIQKNLRLPQSTISQHLSVLKDRGIVTARRDGVKTCYSISHPFVLQLIRFILKKG